MDQELEHIRHSLAHVLAAAALEYDPQAQLGIGPAIDNGFYYDIKFSKPFSDDALPKLEQRMREIIERDLPFTGEEVSADEARQRFHMQPFKLELIDELEAAGEAITTYALGDLFVDLCRGGHAERTSIIPKDGFALSHIAGAYWKGHEKNPMLTRIYGLAFNSAEDLAAYRAQQEEAKQRDHRKIGKEQDLFVFSDLVGAGLPLWTPKGTIIRHALDAYIWELRQKHGFQRVTIPHLTKRDLYEVSGHWEKFGDELFRISTREGKEYALKPMNCPHHAQLFARRPHSYRDMPQRYAETTMVYRDEQSGELGGLTRVLSITQDDSHVFCRTAQVKDEFFRIWDIVDTFYGTFGFSLRVRLSFHEPKEMEKYLGTPEIWQHAEQALRDIAQARNADYFEAPGEAAMYGPKLDFMARDSLGREHQVATIQLDMNLPERFDLACTNERGEKERIVMIHCAIAGSIERFAAVLFEHVGGAFPLWLAPEQIAVIPVSQKHHDYARDVFTALSDAGIRAVLDDADESLGKKIRAAKQHKLPYFIVLGDKEVAAQALTLESRDGSSETLDLSALIARLQQENTERR